ncbi:YheC/YheD family protein [Alteribacillus sp. JSM 102045]|uniref:YheC/YheD family protein n=1 Tax=Alteribacillus sp. JSM 102045 TaxID=1562101 RepID=UPI0035C13B32
MKIKGRNKWKLYLALKKNKKLRPYLVPTKKWSKNNFEYMLSKYQSIVVKPNKGLKANDIYFISKIDSGYEIQIYEKKNYFSTRQEAYKFMKKTLKDVANIIQKRIDIAKIDGRPFDFRVIIQRKTLSSPWTATAYKVRVAGKGRMVTNASKGGHLLTFKEAMEKRAVPGDKMEQLIEHIKYVSVTAAKALNAYYPKKRLYGIDIGMMNDESLHIFEINRKPLLKGFTKKHQKMIKRFRKGG